jgi:hypothetical protein
MLQGGNQQRDGRGLFINRIDEIARALDARAMLCRLGSGVFTR